MKSEAFSFVSSQRLTFPFATWCERVITDENGGKAMEPRVLVCHIANLHAKHEDDFIYANKFHEVYQGHAEPPHGKRIHFHGWVRTCVSASQLARP